MPQTVKVSLTHMQWFVSDTIEPLNLHIYSEMV